MSDLKEYDDGVAAFLKGEGIVNPFFVIAVDEDGEPHAFAAPGKQFVKTYAGGGPTEAAQLPNNESVSWTIYEGSRRGKTRIGGSKYRF